MPIDSKNNSFSELTNALLKAFEVKTVIDAEKKISVNILVSRVASWYEKLRTAMDYGNEETILRRAIERILKRRLFMDADPKSLAEDLVRELLWARYFEDATLPESLINSVSLSIKLYLKLKNSVIAKKVIPSDDVYECIIQLLSCEIEIG